MGDYRKLEVWRRSRIMCQRVDKVIAKLPSEFRAQAREQLGEAVRSIRHNIAEGAGLNLDTLLAKHLRSALGSANEVQDELEDLDERALLAEEDRDLIQEASEIRAMVAAFHRTVLDDIERAKKAKSRQRNRQRSRAKRDE